MDKKTIIEPILPEPDEKEIWKVCEDFPAYEVSSFGQVRNKKTEHILSQNQQTVNGYYRVHLRLGTDRPNGVCISVHTLVNIAFSGMDGRQYGKQTDHIDRNRHNNYYKNLRWVSPKENSQRRICSNKKKIYTKKTPIVQIDRESGKVINRFKSLIQAHEILGLSLETMHSAVKGIYQYKKWIFKIDE